MNSVEIQYQMNRLIQRNCHCQAQLSEAENIARDLKREFEMQESERVIAQGKAATS